MKKKKNKYRLKYKNIAIMFLIVAILIFLIKKGFQKPFKVELKESYIKVEDEITKDLVKKATFKKTDVTEKVKIKNTTCEHKIGKCEIIFVVEVDGKIYEFKRKVESKDTTKPEITLVGNKEITILKGTSYKELGYEVIDNYDKDLKEKVKVKGTVDTSKEGEYILTYEVEDSSKNKTIVERKVIVSAKSPIDLDLKDFTLEGLFKGTILEKTEDKGDSYINSIIFAGDSMPLYYVMNKMISGKNLWHRESIDPEKALTNTIYINHMESNMTFVQAFEKYQPEIVIMTLGTNSAGFMKVEYFIECYTELIKQIKKVSPNTKLIIQSIPPVDGSYDNNTTGINNKKINTFNYYIAEMCSNLGVKFLNSAPAMKDENGACKKGYCSWEAGEHGIHPTKEGNQVLIDYTKTHAF